MIDLSKIRDLHNITAIETIPSILEHGILSHNRAKAIQHKSVASLIIQARRENKQIPGGLRLHDYAILYFDAHNKMLSKLRSINDEIGILIIRKDVLYLDDVVVSDRNASSDYVRFYNVETGIQNLDFDKIYDRFWIHDDPIEQWIHGSIKCAEALIPNCVSPEYISGIIVYSNSVKTRLESMGIPLQITVNSSIFFLGYDQRS